MRRVIVALLLVLAAGGGAFWYLSMPQPLATSDLPDHAPDLANGELVFNAGGCASCHASREAGAERTVLSGGLALATPLGPITVPNISPDPTHGIGGWSALDLANAMTEGIAPDGRYYTPAFPWTSYRGMRLEDIIDLKAFLDTLPASDASHDTAGLPFPFSWRRPIGLWKRFAMESPPPVPAGADDAVTRGHYLVTTMGHCAACHTPRTITFAEDMSRWLAGAPAVDGDGFIPNITPSADGLGEWAPADIAYLLETGFTPDFDSVGGEMGAVVSNWAHVSAADRAAVAAYLKAIPPLPTDRP